MTLSPYLLVGLAAVVLVLLYQSVRTARARKSMLDDIQGPENPSFWIGNENDIRYQGEVGDVDFKWMREYGSVWRVKGCMGENSLMIADPKALQYVLQTSGYRFPKRPDAREVTRMILGRGIVWADGHGHQRQRRIMSPAFSAAQLKSFLPLFQRYGLKLVEKLRGEIASGAEANKGTDGSLINLVPWFSRTTLDIIGEAGFNYEFGGLDDAETELSKVYNNLFIDSTLYPSKLDIVFKSFWRYIPETPLHLVRYLPSREYRRFRQYTEFMNDFARRIVEKNEAQGDAKDIISVLMRANASENPRSKLSDYEVFDQISTLLLAGHDTTATSLDWLFWELGKHPEWQTRIREEIAAVRAQVTARGDTDFSMGDLEGMSSMQAALKEAMRLHPIVWQIVRNAAQDDVIPLAFPITTRSGKVINAVPVRKGQSITVSICSYNRLPEVWGADADKWNPERFLNIDKSKQTSVGVYANLMNFSAGIRGCIGWKFSVIEMQAIVATLLENFEFTLPPAEKGEIIRKPTALMVPMSDTYPGAWMGLHVKSVA
ncbi:cytochrome P450 [Dentipellis sp. KUC8613]|nr:cytochrome P450 [Dentipellis sp. KUC8613]